MTNTELHNAAIDIRKELLDMHGRSYASHIGSAYSILEILLVLYYRILHIYPDDPKHPERDRFILSKGHSVSALYAVLAHRGLLSKELLDTFHLDNTTLLGHPDRSMVPFIEASTGSLGHGLSIAAGIAAVLKQRKSDSRAFVLMSDGEIQEGSVWEAANLAARMNLDNLIAIVDINRWQAFDRTDFLMKIDTFAEKWNAFGWSVKRLDGHDFDGLTNGLSNVPVTKGKPSVFLMDTVKGKGVSQFEDRLEWHYRSPKSEQIELIKKELDEKYIH